MHVTSHVDRFAAERLPPREQWPELLFELPELQFSERLNCARDLLDAHIEAGRGDRVCLRSPDGLRWTYADLQRHANRIANVLVHELGVVPGNRVLLRSANKPMLVACWFGVMKAGAIAVATMPLLRAKELGQIIAKAQTSHALCDRHLRAELADKQVRDAVRLALQIGVGPTQPVGRTQADPVAVPGLDMGVEQVAGAVQALRKLQLGQLEQQLGPLLARRQALGRKTIDMAGCRPAHPSFLRFSPE